MRWTRYGLWWSPRTPTPPSGSAYSAARGNNGGDGIAAARILLEGGLSGPHLSGGRPGEDDPRRPGHGGAAGRVGWRSGALGSGGPPADRLAVHLRLLCGRPVRSGFEAAGGGGLSGGSPVDERAAGPCGVLRPALRVGRRGHREVLGEAVRARTTVTFTCAKPGLYLGAGAGCAGEVQEADIGIPGTWSVK